MQTEYHHPSTVFYHQISQGANLSELAAKALHRVQRSLQATEITTDIVMSASYSVHFFFLNKPALEENCNQPLHSFSKKVTGIKKAMFYDRNLVTYIACMG